MLIKACNLKSSIQTLITEQYIPSQSINNRSKGITQKQASNETKNYKLTENKSLFGGMVHESVALKERWEKWGSVAVGEDEKL